MARVTRLSDNDRRFLIELARAAIDSARVAPGERAASPDGTPTGIPNMQYFAIVAPGGRGCYPALWVADLTFTVATGLVSAAEGLKHLRLITACHNRPEWRRLDGGAAIWPYADGVAAEASGGRAYGGPLHPDRPGGARPGHARYCAAD